MKVAIYGRLLDNSKAQIVQYLFDELRKRKIECYIYDGFYAHLVRK